MITFRLIQTPVPSSDQFQVRIEMEESGASRRSAQVFVTPNVTDQDREQIRWYLEDYLLHPHEPAPKIAQSIEARMNVIGESLFEATFQGNDDARDLWAQLRDRLNDARVEISTGVAHASTIPWELLRDKRTGQALALGAREFVRVQSQTARKPRLVKPETDSRVRILLVICRPDGPQDVPFRSVAGRLVKGLTDEGRERVKLDVLRPPTYSRLAEVLRDAKEQGLPYHVLHFDGHGLYADAEELSKGIHFDSQILRGPASGLHGWLAFEKEDGNDGFEPVGGDVLGELMFNTDVPVLILNACRSAFAEQNNGAETPDPEAQDSHQHMVRAYGSLAQEVVDQGVAGVVAMRYSVYVVTAAQFIGDFYKVLTTGASLGQAATRGRKALKDSPARHVGPRPISLQDWPVPVIFEAFPLHLFPVRSETDLFDIRQGTTMAAFQGDELPPPPDMGFFGRDETLLVLDRAFDRHHIVLLHAYAGSGKSSAAVEFARWYSATGGIEKGTLLFDNFANRLTVRELVDKLGAKFEGIWTRHNIHWQATSEAEQRNYVLQILKKIPVLWIWDNVEPVAGFPAGADSSWTPAEQEDLAKFLQELSKTKAKVLLTSRRDERAWLKNLPTRITMPPMPMWERRALTVELVRRHGGRPSLVELLEPLLEFSDGNPMTINVVIGQALRDKLSDKVEIDNYLDALRKGTVAFSDDVSQGRSRSLGASLDYGFRAAFSDAERDRLALLHLFQAVVQVEALCLMGEPSITSCLDSVRGMSKEEGVALLDRAAEIGLLSKGQGFYRIHPALPWFLKTLFDQTYPAEGGLMEMPAFRAEKAYAMAMAEIGNAIQQNYVDGYHRALALLKEEEHNLLHARSLALHHARPKIVIMAMQGLEILYTVTGRWGAWTRLVAEVEPLVAEADEGPKQDLLDEWDQVIKYRADLAEHRHDVAETLRLLRLSVDKLHESLSPLLATDVANWSPIDRNHVRSLAASFQQLGTKLCGQNDPAALSSLNAAYELCRRIDDRQAQAIAAFNIGLAYKEIKAVRDFDAAEEWYKTSLGLRGEHDSFGQAVCHGQFGNVALRRFDALLKNPNPDRRELIRLLQQAESGYLQALNLFPDQAWAERAVAHHMLANVYSRASMESLAVEHYRHSIDLEIKSDNIFGAGETRFSLAQLLLRNKQLDAALGYARAARNDYASYGEHAAENIAEADKLIAIIEQALAQTGEAVPEST